MESWIHGFIAFFTLAHSIIICFSFVEGSNDGMKMLSKSREICGHLWIFLLFY